MLFMRPFIEPCCSRYNNNWLFICLFLKRFASYPFDVENKWQREITKKKKYTYLFKYFETNFKRLTRVLYIL